MFIQFKRFVSIAALGFAALMTSTTASATLLTAKTNIDNGYSMYISTSDSVQGTLFGSGNNWYNTFTNTTNLVAGTDYFLHIFAYDQGGIAGFLGQFDLSGADHTFSNTLTSLTTNTTNWTGNNSGWGVSGSLVDLGAHGVGPWGTGYSSTVSPSARWIWAGNADNNDTAYFSTKISAKVPEPSSVFLFSLGLLGLGFMRHRKAAK
jgi:PEP-CTERM motif